MHVYKLWQISSFKHSLYSTRDAKHKMSTVKPACLVNSVAFTTLQAFFLGPPFGALLPNPYATTQALAGPWACLRLALAFFWVPRDPTHITAHSTEEHCLTHSASCPVTRTVFFFFFSKYLDHVTTERQQLNPLQCSEPKLEAQQKFLEHMFSITYKCQFSFSSRKTIKNSP